MIFFTAIDKISQLIERSETMAIDVIDEKLLSVLQENARISISELSKRINLSLSAVSERLKKLEASGVIRQYTAILDPIEMEKNVLGIVMVSVAGDPRLSDFIKFVNTSDSVMSCSRCTGAYDYIVKICAKNQSELQDVLDSIKRIRGVNSLYSSVLLDDLKISYSVPPLATK